MEEELKHPRDGRKAEEKLKHPRDGQTIEEELDIPQDGRKTEEEPDHPRKECTMEKGVSNLQGGDFAGYLRDTLKLQCTDIKTYSPLTLAFIGDSIFDLIIRTAVVEGGNAPVNKLHKQAAGLVQAKAQAELYHQIKEQLTEEESAIYKRGRNAKSFTSAKNAGVLEYRTATGLEALTGYLYLTGRVDRLLELMTPHLEKVSEHANHVKSSGPLPGESRM